MALRHATLHQLKIFNTLAYHLSVVRTAESLHLSPPAVSIQIKQLSESVGQPLMDQVGKKLYLTAAGEILAQACRDIFTRIETVSQELDSLNNLEQGHVRIALITTAKFFIPRILGKFCEKYPGVEPSLFIGNRKAVLERLADNKDDLYILGMPPDNINIEAVPFASNQIIAVAQKDHLLGEKKSITPVMLENEHFIIREEGSGIRMATENYFREHKCMLNIRMELSSNEAIKQCILAGLGVAFMSESTVENTLESGEIIKLNVKGLPIKREWYIIHSKQKTLSPLADSFKSFLVAGCLPGALKK